MFVLVALYFSITHQIVRMRRGVNGAMIAQAERGRALGFNLCTLVPSMLLCVCAVIGFLYGRCARARPLLIRETSGTTAAAANGSNSSSSSSDV